MRVWDLEEKCMSITNMLSEMEMLQPDEKLTIENIGFAELDLIKTWCDSYYNVGKKLEKIAMHLPKEEPDVQTVSSGGTRTTQENQEG